MRLLYAESKQKIHNLKLKHKPKNIQLLESSFQYKMLPDFGFLIRKRYEQTFKFGIFKQFNIRKLNNMQF